MKYLGKQVNGQATRNNFIRSMDIVRNRSVDDALAAYSGKWFSSRRKQYLNEALKHVMGKSLFWTKKAMADMLEEIQLETDLGSDDRNRQLARDVDLLKSRLAVWGSARRNNPISDADITAYVKEFEAKYRYACPDTYRSCWMNTGAYITLSYGIKYEGLSFPGCMTPDESLALLKKCALEVIAGMAEPEHAVVHVVVHAGYHLQGAFL